MHVFTSRLFEIRGITQVYWFHKDVILAISKQIIIQTHMTSSHMLPFEKRVNLLTFYVSALLNFQLEWENTAHNSTSQSLTFQRAH